MDIEQLQCLFERQLTKPKDQVCNVVDLKSQPQPMVLMTRAIPASQDALPNRTKVFGGRSSLGCDTLMMASAIPVQRADECLTTSS